MSIFPGQSLFTASLIQLHPSGIIVTERFPEPPPTMSTAVLSPTPIPGLHVMPTEAEMEKSIQA